MNVNRISHVMEAYHAGARKPVPGARKTGTGRDEVSISREGRVFEIAKKAAQSVPEVREDRVAALAKKIESGNYSVPAASVVAKLLI
ncbi:MAG: flagellar biosynthesis anti-sigma factor FlgM [Clostridiales bacterium]|jgi:flagellar biosynthesis anti-sigma factor FlgM|nr:flagellar biosynthesis anti-sigma factor FlgM [Clostridiales bacterium]